MYQTHGVPQLELEGLCVDAQFTLKRPCKPWRPADTMAGLPYTHPKPSDALSASRGEVVVFVLSADGFVTDIGVQDALFLPTDDSILERLACRVEEAHGAFVLLA